MKTTKILIRSWSLLSLCLLSSIIGHAQLMTNKGDTISIKNNTLMSVKGGFNNIDNGHLSPCMINNGILRVDSNWDAVNDMIYLGMDTFMASGNGKQNLAGLTYYNLMITNGGIKTISRKTYIKNKLIVSNGNLNTGSDSVQLDSAATLAEDSNNNVQGQIYMKKYLAKGVSYNFGNLGFDFIAHGGIPGMTSVVRVTGSGSTQHYSSMSGIARYFDVHPANDRGLNADITFHYYPGELNGIAESDLTLFRSEDNGVKWFAAKYTSRSASSHTIGHTAIDSFSRWTLGSNSSPLPVTLISFNAALAGQNVAINWATASEENNDHFDVERSFDVKDWNLVQRESGYGTTQEMHNYAAMDYNVTEYNDKVLYYRLKQVDYNGKMSYSDIRAVKLNPSIAIDDLKTWFDKDENKIFINITSSEELESRVFLIDMNGNTITQQKINVNKVLTQLSLNMDGLAKGIYIINYSNENTTKSKKIVKY